MFWAHAGSIEPSVGIMGTIGQGKRSLTAQDPGQDYRHEDQPADSPSCCVYDARGHNAFFDAIGTPPAH